MREHKVQCSSPHGLHQMAYTEWGDPKNPRVLICVHGLTRSGRDFDYLATALSDHYRVICPDVVGRGKSDWLAVKDSYQVPQYFCDMVTLIARLRVESVHWLGTSLGGLIGMALAAQAKTPITRLILNDVGPVLTAVSLARIAQFVGLEPKFASIEAAEAHVRAVSAQFGQFSDAQWRYLTVNVTRPIVSVDGKTTGFEMAYDPGIAQPFKAVITGKDIDLWSIYDVIRCPTLLIRGAESDLLTRETAIAMTDRGPRANTIEFPNVGHAPMFLDEEQVKVVRDFLVAV